MICRANRPPRHSAATIGRRLDPGTAGRHRWAKTTKPKPAAADEIAALARIVDLLRQKLGPQAAADLLESYELDLAAEADRQETDDPPAA